MAYRQEIWDIFYDVPSLIALPEYLQRIADGGKGAGQVKSDKSTEDIMKRAKTAALEILGVLEAPWKQSTVEELELERLSGGFTNLVFKCVVAGTQPVILKVEFPKPQVDKDREYEIVRIMADSELGPRLLATYPEGRIEEFLDVRIAKEEEMQDPKFGYELGKKLAAIHSIPIGKEDDELPTVLRGYLERIKKSGRSSIDPKPANPIPYSYPATVTLTDLENEVDKIEQYLKKKFSRSVHLVHNDLFLSNVLIAKKAGSHPTAGDITLIDYEFSMRTHRALEVGFCRDLTVNPFTPAAETSHEKDRAYCRGYLEQIYQTYKERLGEVNLTGDMERDSKLLLEEMDAAWPIVVFFWGLWHVVCDAEGNNQLDYEMMYRDKLAVYYALKNTININ